MIDSQPGDTMKAKHFFGVFSIISGVLFLGPHEANAGLAGFVFFSQKEQLNGKFLGALSVYVI